ncbi:hypothetical protein [Xanthomonas vesicatoria]|uniref:hypothetical protein n=1 Tax=Xanthomonas vesicatoria TaxID=56460 RepID=UPI003CCD16BE
MSGSTQHPANAQLHALAHAHQLGQIDRAQYRARRRNVLDAARQAQGATLRNPQPPLRDTRSSPPLPRDRFSQYRGRAAAIVVLVTAVALMLLIFHKCTSWFDRRSVRGQRDHTDIHAGMHPYACPARHVGHARQRKFSGVSDVCV